MKTNKDAWTPVDNRIPLECGCTIILNRQNLPKEYIIDCETGRGASSIVYKAHYFEGGRQYNYILKELYPINLSCLIRRNRNDLEWLGPIDSVEQSKKDFENGLVTQTMLSLQSGIVNSIINGVLLEGNNTLYIGMDYNEGQDFQTYLDNEWHDNPRYLHDVLKVLRALVQIIEKYHEKGYMLFDIKPDNIFVMPETSELIKLFDCDSICTLEDILQNRERISFTGEWAAPEIRNGQLGRISAATDFYAIGSMLYYAIFGCTPKVSDYNEVGKKWDAENIQTFNPYEYDGVLLKDLEIFTKTLLKRKLTKGTDIVCRIDQLIELSNPVTPHIKNSNIIDTKDSRYEELSRIVEENLQENNLLLVEGLKLSGKTEFIKICLSRFKEKYEIIQYVDASTYDSLEKAVVGGLLTTPVLDDTNSRTCFEKKCELMKNSKGKTLIVLDNLNIQCLDNIEYFERMLSGDNTSCKVIIVSNWDHHELGLPTVHFETVQFEATLALFLRNMEKRKWSTGQDVVSMMNIIEISGGYLPLTMIILCMMNEALDFSEVDELDKVITKESIKTTEMEIYNPFFFQIGKNERNKPIHYVEKLWNLFDFDNDMLEILYILAYIDYPIKRELLVQLTENKYRAQRSLDVLTRRFIIDNDEGVIRLPSYIKTFIYLSETDDFNVEYVVDKIIEIITDKADSSNCLLLQQVLRKECTSIRLLWKAATFFINAGDLKGLDLVETYCDKLESKSSLFNLMKGKIKYYKGDEETAHLLLNSIKADELSVIEQVELRLLQGEINKRLGLGDYEKFYKNSLNLILDNETLLKELSDSVNDRYDTARSVILKKLLSKFSMEKGLSEERTELFSLINCNRWEAFDTPLNELRTIELAHMTLRECECELLDGEADFALYLLLTATYRLKSCTSKRGTQLRLAGLLVLDSLVENEVGNELNKRLKECIECDKSRLLKLYKDEEDIFVHSFFSNLHFEKGKQYKRNVDNYLEAEAASFKIQVTMIAKSRGWIRDKDEEAKLEKFIEAMTMLLLQNTKEPTLLTFRKLLYTLDSPKGKSTFDEIIKVTREERLSRFRYAKSFEYYENYKKERDNSSFLAIPIISECVDILLDRIIYVNSAKYESGFEIINLVRAIDPSVIKICSNNNSKY